MNHLSKEREAEIRKTHKEHPAGTGCEVADLLAALDAARERVVHLRAAMAVARNMMPKNDPVNRELREALEADDRAAKEQA